MTPEKHICDLAGSCSECSILFQVQHMLMEAKLAEYRARKRRETAKQFVCKMVTFNSHQHVGGNEINVPLPVRQEVNALSSH
jgi:hypothetical protein